MIPRENTWPFDTSTLASRIGSVVAHRIQPPLAPRQAPLPAIACCLLGVLGSALSVGFSLPLCLLLSVCVTLAGLAGVCRRSVEKRPVIPPLAAQFKSWSDLVTAIQSSSHTARVEDDVIAERDHVFVGTVDGTSCPLLVHVKSLQHHVQVCGSPASGKTFRFLVPVATQVMRRRDSSIVVVDLKGSPDLFNTFRTRANALGLPFKYFTVSSTLPSHVFNPMLMPCFREFTPGEKVESLLQALGLEYGEGFGRAHFGAVNEDVLRAVLDHHPDVASLRDVAAILRAPGARRALRLEQRTFEQGSGLRSVLTRCAAIKQLVATPEDDLPRSVFDAAIDLDEVFERPSILYFHLPTTQQRTSARVVGRLVTGLLVANARRRKLANQALRPVYTLVDEFLQIVDTSFEPLLQQARDVKVSFWLAHQYLDGLSTPAGDFRSLLKNTCHLNTLFTVTDATGRDFVTTSGGEVRRTYRSTSHSSTTSSRSSSTSTGSQERDQVEPRFTQEHINRVNRDPNLAFFSLNPGHGFCKLKHMVVARIGFAQSAAEYQRLASMPWPAPGPQTIVASALASAPPSPSPSSGTRRIRRAAGDEAATVKEAPPMESGVPERPATGRVSAGRRRRVRREVPAAEARQPEEVDGFGRELRALHDLLSSDGE